MSVLILIFSIALPSSLLGGVLAYRLGFRDLEVLIPVGAGLAVVAYLLGLNFLAYVVPIQTSFWLVGLLLFALAAALLAQGWRTITAGTAGDKSVHLDPRATMIIAVATLVYGLFFGIIILSTRGFDANFHWPLISTISHGNFAPRLPQNPDLYALYHYGFDLFAAAVAHLGDLDPWTGSALVTSASVVLSVLLASALGYYAWNSLRAALLLPFLLFFGGGLLYLDVFRDLAPSSDIWGSAQQIVDRFFSQQPFARGYFHGSMSETFAVVLHHRPSAVAMPFFLLFLLLAYVQFRQPRLITAVLMGAVLAALALTLETTFAIIVASFAIYRGSSHFLRWRRQGIAAIGREAAYDGVTLAVAGLLAVVEGGVITGALLYRDSGEVSGSYTSFSLRREIGFVSGAGFVPIGEHDWWQTVLKEFGFPLLFFPAYVFVALRKPHPLTTLLLIISTLAFLTPLFVEYTYDTELRRFFNLSQCSNGLLMAISLHYLLSAARRWYALLAVAPAVAPAVALLLGLTAFSPLMFNLRLLPNRPALYDPPIVQTDTCDPSYATLWGVCRAGLLSPSAEQTVANAAQSLVPERARVLTATPVTVMILWGRFASFAESEILLFHPTEDWERALQSPDLSLLQQLKIDYVYWSPAWAELSGRNFDLERLPYLTRVYDYTDSSGQEYAIYRVQGPP